MLWPRRRRGWLVASSAWWIEGFDGGPFGIELLAEKVRSGELISSTQVGESAEGPWAEAGVAIPALFAQPTKGPGSGWTDVSPHPWRRYGARMVDNTVVGTVTWTIIAAVAYSVAPEQADAFFQVFEGPGGAMADGLLTLMAAMPGNALLIGLTGLSIGKWIFGIRVLRDGKPIGFLSALNREIDIWTRGLAFGIPFVSLFTLYRSHERLTLKRRTPWDQRQGNVVTHRPTSQTSVFWMWVVAAILFLAVVASRLLATLP
jgi:RDD family